MKNFEKATNNEVQAEMLRVDDEDFYDTWITVEMFIDTVKTLCKTCEKMR